MIRSYAEVKQALDAKIPADCVSEREGGGSKKLSYLESWYVIARLNEVLGQGNWQYNTEEMRQVFADKVNDKFTVHYVSKVSLSWLAINEQGQRYAAAVFSDYGYGDGSDKHNIGKAHELAVKEAVSDGVKRCAKNLGMSLGLALYDKTREFVETEAPAPIKAAPKPAAEPVLVESPKAVAEVAPAVVSAPTQEKPKEEAVKLIRGTIRTLVNMKKRSAEEIKGELSSKYGTDSADKLTPPQANEWLSSLTQTLNA